MLRGGSDRVDEFFVVLGPVGRVPVGPIVPGTAHVGQHGAMVEEIPQRPLQKVVDHSFLHVDDDRAGSEITDLRVWVGVGVGMDVGVDLGVDLNVGMDVGVDLGVDLGMGMGLHVRVRVTGGDT